MRHASSAIDFLSDPVGSCWVGRRFGVFAHSPTLLGCALWGRAGTDDVRDLLRAVAFGLRPDMTRYRWVVDMRGLQSLSARGLGLLLDHVRRNYDVLGRNILQQAYFPPRGLLGAALLGVSLVTDLPFPARAFGADADAFEWLGLPVAAGLGLLAELEGLRHEPIDGLPVARPPEKRIAPVDPVVLRSSRG